MAQAGHGASLDCSGTQAQAGSGRRYQLIRELSAVQVQAEVSNGAVQGRLGGP